MNQYFYFLNFLKLLLHVNAVFNKHFSDFLRSNYDETFLKTLQRNDLGAGGSFGGKNSNSEEIKFDPVIFIHGVSGTAGENMLSLAASYKSQGYTNGELYATTYGPGAKNGIMSWIDYSLKCEYVKQIRTFILAVRYYTSRDIDIVAYSLGVPIARKAVLGGTCVDTNEYLGENLTAYIDTFVGVAGPNHGVSTQVAGFYIPSCAIGAVSVLPICGKTVGLYSGLCPTESAFLTDINEKHHYEGRYVYSLLTKSDEWIGYKICDKVTARIPEEDGSKEYRTFSHTEVLLRTTSQQLKFIQSPGNNATVSNVQAFKKFKLSETELINDLVHLIARIKKDDATPSKKEQRSNLSIYNDDNNSFMQRRKPNPEVLTANTVSTELKELATSEQNNIHYEATKSFSNSKATENGYHTHLRVFID